MNIFLEVLVEIKEQNRELKASLTSLPTAPPQPRECNQQIHIEGLAQKLKQQIRHNNEFREELIGVLTKLGERIRKMKAGIAEAWLSQDEPTGKLLTELQAQQLTPEVKVTQCYLFDAKRWTEWCVWGIMVTAIACIVGWASHLYGLNLSLESQAIRYRAIRMELGRSHPKIAKLDSLFSAEDSDASIRRLRQQVLAYEATLLRHAELQLQQQHIHEEKTSLFHQLQKEQDSWLKVYESSILAN